MFLFVVVVVVVFVCCLFILWMGYMLNLIEYHLDPNAFACDYHKVIITEQKSIQSCRLYITKIAW